MDNVPKQLHHSVTDQSVIRTAEEFALPRLEAYGNGKPIYNLWHSGPMDIKELTQLSADSIKNLLILVNRLKKHANVCKNCSGVGTVTERMGGCRDDNESVICPECNGRFVL
jgi:hypothetical protein